MNSQPKRVPKDTFEKTDDLIRLAADAINDAQAESRKLGIPNIYSINGQIYRETPSGLEKDPPRPENGE